MKKFLSLFLCIIFCSSLFTACGTSKRINEIGDLTQNEDFEMTLLNVEFADSLNMDKTSETFCQPMSEDEREQNKLYSLVGQDGNALLCFSFEYKFIGNSEIKDHFGDYGEPTVIYGGDYTFSENYIVFQKTEQYPDWHFFSTDSNNWETTRSKLGLGNMIWLDGKYTPLEEKTYIVRGFISVPEKVRIDTESSLEIVFNYLGQKYTIR